MSTITVPTRVSVAAELRDAARVSEARADAMHYRHLAAMLICTRVSVDEMLAVAAPTERARVFAAGRLRTLVVPSREEYEHAVGVLAGVRGVEDFDTEYSDAELATARVWVAQYEAAQR